jgi:excisionase family DNA binding protein
MLITTDGRALLSTTEAHERSGLSRDHLGLMIRRGRIAAMKIGNNWFIFEESLNSYLHSARKPGPKPHRSSDDASMPRKERNREK